MYFEVEGKLRKNKFGINYCKINAKNKMLSRTQHK